MSWSIEGKQVLVTGASRGIGRVTALELAKKGANVSLLVRNRELGLAVVKEIEALGAKGKVDLFVADMSSQKDIRRVAAEYREKHDRLDVLVNNAGAVIMERATTADGLEATFATNHLGYFLLTTLLLDLLKTSAPARIVSVSSDVHRNAKMAWDDLQGEKSFSGFGAYGQSKLANALFTVELAKRLEGTGVTANCLHPGVIASQFGRNNKGIMGFFVRVAAPFMASEEDGAKTSVFLASSPEVEGVTGKYFKKSRAVAPSPAAQDEKDAARLWTVSEELVAKSA
ncbi:MAG TPA: SDR family oxidoreductase [Polyangiaceae bacterium]